MRLAGNRYLEAVLIPVKNKWREIIITISIVLGVLVITALLLAWQFPKLSKELAAWQLKYLKSR